MAFSRECTHKCEDVVYTSYDDTNLNFLLISNKHSFFENFVLFKSRFVDNFYAEDRIINLINNYNFVNYNSGTLYYSNFKFINIDNLITNMIENLNDEDRNNNVLDINLDMKIQNGSQDMSFIFNVYNSKITLNIESELKESMYVQKNKNLNFKDSAKYTMSCIGKKLYDMLINIYKINFEKIDKYINFLDMFSYYNHTEFLKKLKYSYNNYRIPYSEIVDFNNLNIDFDNVDFFCETYNNEYLQFLKMISSPENVVSVIKLRYYRFVMKDTEDSDGNTIKGLSSRYGDLTVHVPLLNSYFTYNHLKITKNYIDYYDIESRIFKKLIKIYFYIFKKSDVFVKFKDQYEKIILK